MNTHLLIALALFAGNALSADAIEKPPAPPTTISSAQVLCAAPSTGTASSASTGAGAQASACDSSAAGSVPSRDADWSTTPKRMPRKARQ